MLVSEANHRVWFVASLVILSICIALTVAAIVYAIVEHAKMNNDTRARQGGDRATQPAHAVARRTEFRPGCGVPTKVGRLMTHEAEYLLPCGPSLAPHTQSQHTTRGCDGPIYVHGVLEPTECKSIVESYESDSNASKSKHQHVMTIKEGNDSLLRSAHLIFKEKQDIAVAYVVKISNSPFVDSFCKNIFDISIVRSACSTTFSRDTLTQGNNTLQNERHHVCIFLSDLDGDDAGGRLVVPQHVDERVYVNTGGVDCARSAGRHVLVRPACGNGILWSGANSPLVSVLRPLNKATHVYLLLLVTAAHGEGTF